MRPCYGVLLSVLGLLARERTAAAAACCGESHGLGDRLAGAESAAVTSSLRLRERVGAWNASARWAGLPGGDHDRELRLDVGWLVRVRGSLQLGASVPALVTWRSAGGISSTGGGVGDVTALARFDAIPPTGRGPLPGIALTFGALVPTGRSAAESDDVIAADVTGLGAGELRPGIAVEKDWLSGWYVLGVASLGLRTASRLNGEEVQLAPHVTLAGLGGRSFSGGASLGIGTVFEREAGPSIGGDVAPRSVRQRTAALLFGAYDVNDRWTAQASLQADLPIPELGRNEIVGVAGSLGVRYAWGRRD